MDKTTSLQGAEAFAASAQKVVDYLERATPIANWSVSRVVDGEQVHLHVHEGDFITAGDRIDWDVTFCSRMVAGADRVVPDSLAHPAYADLEAAKDVRAYAGVPINTPNGELFGVLCGVRSETLSSADAVDRDLLALLSELLSSQLVLARAADADRLEASTARTLANVDALTGLLNRRGWEDAVRDAQERLDAYGDPCGVAVIDLDGLKRVNDTQGHEAGDHLLVRAAQTLAAAARPGDAVARYGGDEFTIVSAGIAPHSLDEHVVRFADALSRAGVAASWGCAAALSHHTTIGDAFLEADAAMYDRKRRARRAEHA